MVTLDLAEKGGKKIIKNQKNATFVPFFNAELGR